METNLQSTAVTTTATLINSHEYDDDSNCSTPYVSAPSSPGHRTTTTTNFLSPPRHPSSFFFYSAPTSPMHYVLSSTAAACGGSVVRSDASSSESFEFDFSSRFDSPAAPEIVAADELFLNGQIRPMKLRAHLSRPDRIIDDIIEGDNDNDDNDNDNDDVFNRSRDVNKSQRRSRRTRSMSPMRNTPPFDWINQSDDAVPITTTNNETDTTTTTINKQYDSLPSSASSSRCSSAGRSSKRWIFLKDFLRSKSEGRSNNKFWQNINMSFSPVAKDKDKDKKTVLETEKKKKRSGKGKGRATSAHEKHYAEKRAEVEEMRKKTYLPYRQGLLGCLGFNSKSYGAFHGFTTTLNPLSSR